MFALILRLFYFVNVPQKRNLLTLQSNHCYKALCLVRLMHMTTISPFNVHTVLCNSSFPVHISWKGSKRFFKSLTQYEESHKETQPSGSYLKVPLSETIFSLPVLWCQVRSSCKLILSTVEICSETSIIPVLSSSSFNRQRHLIDKKQLLIDAVFEPFNKPTCFTFKITKTAFKI